MGTVFLHESLNRLCLQGLQPIRLFGRFFRSRLLFYNGGALYDNRINRHIPIAGPDCGGRILYGGDDIHTLDHSPKTQYPHLICSSFEVEEVIVHCIDKELRGGGMGCRSACHGDSALQVFETIVRLVGDRWQGGFLRILVSNPPP